MKCKLPAVFRGCLWDDHWEFDAPCVVYYPKRLTRYQFSNNSGGIDGIVEDICYDIEQGSNLHDGGWEAEREWRGWGARPGCRKNAWHVEIYVRWVDDHGELTAEIISRKEKWGPFKKMAEAAKEGKGNG